jgi:hypothetical protein
MLSVIIYYCWLTTLGALILLASKTRDNGVRLAALVCVASSALGIIASHLLPHWHGPHPELFVLDTLATIALLVVAVRDGRTWSATAAGVQGAHVGLHVIYFIDRSHISAAYYTGFTILGFLLAASIFTGAFARR